MRGAILPLAICFVVIFSAALPGANALGGKNVFTVLSATWGASANTVEVGPGVTGAVLTLTVEYTGNEDAAVVQASWFQVPTGFSDANTNGVPSASTVAVKPDTIFQLTYDLNIASNSAVASYSVPIQFLYTSTGTGNTVTGSEIDNAVVNLFGTVSLIFQTPQASLVAGQVDTVAVSLTNTGTGTAYQVAVSASASSVSILGVLPTISSLGAGSSAPLSISLYVPLALAGSSIPLTLTAGYSDPYGLSKTTSQILGLYAVTATVGAPPSLLSFTTAKTSLTPGQINTILITLENLGPSSVSAIHTTISPSSQLSVLNQFPVEGSLEPDSSVNASISVYVPTSTASSAVVLTLAATYADRYGNTDSSTQTLDLYVGDLLQPNLYFQANRQSVIPGGMNAISLTLTNMGTASATRILVTVSVPSQSGSVLGQFPLITKLDEGSSANATLRIYVPSSAASSALVITITTSYTDDLGSGQTSTQTLGLYVASASISVLTYQTLQSSLIPGKVDSVLLQLINLGPVMVSEISSTSTVSSQLGSILGQFPHVASLPVNTKTNGSLLIYVPASASGAPLPVSISTNYVDALGDNQTFIETLNFYVSSAPATQTNDAVSVVALANSVKVGVESSISLVVKDIGESSMYSPTFSLAVTSPLVVIRNSSYSLVGKVVNPGESTTYEASLASGPSAAPGFYSGTLTVAFQDQFGSSVSQNFPVGFVLDSNVLLIIQSPQIMQSNNTVVVSGSLLNEGFSPAYYASVSGSLSAARTASSPYYIGEVDPNTPVPFTITIPYTPGSKPNQAGNISLSINYKDVLGTSQLFKSALSTTLRSGIQVSGSQSSSVTQTSSDPSILYLEYGIIGALGAVTISGIFLVRRQRSHNRVPKKPEDDLKVI